MNTTTRTRTLLAAVALSAPAALLLPSTAADAGPPATPVLNPAPPDYYSCTTNGAGTHCIAQTVETYGPEPTGLFCGSGPAAFEILDQAVDTVDAQRWYDVDGNIVKRKRVNTFDDAFLSSPSGGRVAYTQRDTDTDVFPVPGDITYGTTYSIGSLKATVPGMGAVLVEKGRIVWGTEGTLDKEAGRHDLLDYTQGDASLLDRLCEALRG
jgi:hypothetical protein